MSIDVSIGEHGEFYIFSIYFLMATEIRTNQLLWTVSLASDDRPKPSIIQLNYYAPQISYWTFWQEVKKIILDSRQMDLGWSEFETFCL